MGMFNDILKSEETLFKNIIALDYDYIPKLVPFRELHQKHMATCIKPLLQERNGRNLFIHGPPGIGKTVACRHVLKELEENYDEIESVYINCWEKNSSYKIMMEICEKLGYKLTHNKKTDELFKIVREILNKKSVVFVFDEIDKAEDFDFLYWILEQIYKKSIFLITNYKEWLLNLDERIKSRLTAEMLEFKPYNLPETKSIMEHRTSYAFKDNVLEHDAFEATVKKTYDMQDLRKGLYILREAGNIAEDKSARKITMQEIASAIKKLDDFTINKEDGLDSDGKFIFELIKKNPENKTGDLYKIYSKNGGNCSQKTFTRKLKELERGKFVVLDKSKGGADGNTSTIRLASKAKERKLSEF